MTKQVPETKAKQGGSGRKILIVMIASLVLAGIVWFFVAIYGEAIDPPTADPGMPEKGTTEQPDSGIVSGQSLDQKPASPTIEDPAQAPDASTTGETPDTAPGGTTGQQEPADGQ